MKQVVIVGHGGPEKLQVREAPDPEPKHDEVRIRVKASGINFADILAREGLYPDAPRLPNWMRILLGGVAEGWVRPHVDRSFPLDDAGEAHAYIEERRNVGKVILTT